MMFGYATDEAKEYMPYAISLAHDLVSRLTQVRKENILDYLRPDGKAQVTVEYDENDMPIRLDAIVLSTQHDDKVTMDRLRQDIKSTYLMRYCLPILWIVRPKFILTLLEDL